MERFFKLKEHGTNVRTEIIAGLTTFMAMAYILFVNGLFLGEGGAASRMREYFLRRLWEQAW
ncbi:putative adenine permease PurP [Paenibacillus sp. P1XP2]|nr:putative adenine permease PurP [Paenibacillus sp. P1XP2]